MTGAPFAEALAQVAAALERLGIRYFVAGSVASVFHGEIRTTHDVDIVVELLERALVESGIVPG